MEKWKSRAETMLLGVLLNSTHQTDRSFTNDFRGTVGITSISATAKRVLDGIKCTIEDGKEEGLSSVAGVTSSNMPLSSTTVWVVIELPSSRLRKRSNSHVPTRP